MCRQSATLGLGKLIQGNFKYRGFYFKMLNTWEVPGGPVVRTWHFHYRGPRFNPWGRELRLCELKKKVKLSVPSSLLSRQQDGLVKTGMSFNLPASEPPTASHQSIWNNIHSLLRPPKPELIWFSLSFWLISNLSAGVCPPPPTFCFLHKLVCSHLRAFAGKALPQCGRGLGLFIQNCLLHSESTVARQSWCISQPSSRKAWQYYQVLSQGMWTETKWSTSSSMFFFHQVGWSQGDVRLMREEPCSLSTAWMRSINQEHLFGLYSTGKIKTWFVINY